MKKLLLLLACACIAPALADEPAKGKAKKSQSQVSKTLEKTGRNIWISPSDQERRAKRKAAKSKDKK